MRGRRQVEITGFHGPRRAIVDAAWEMQRQLARAYEASETGGGALRANSAEYNVRKVLDGDDPRRGHKSGALQSALYRVQCFRVRGNQRTGTWTIDFSDRALVAAVGNYVEYFAAAKARGGHIVTMRRPWVNSAVSVLLGSAPSAPREALRPADGRSVLRVALGVATRRALREGVARTGVRVG